MYYGMVWEAMALVRSMQCNKGGVVFLSSQTDLGVDEATIRLQLQL